MCSLSVINATNGNGTYDPERADVISQDDWVVQQEQERELHQPGRFIPIPGFEWSGRTPQGGHHNVYFRRHDQPVRRNPPAEAPRSVETETE